MLSLTDLSVFVLTVAIFWWYKRKTLRDFAATLPGMDGLPLIGNLHKYYGIEPEALYSLFAGFTKCYETNFKAWIGPFLMLFIRDADDLKTILNSEKCFHKVSILYEKVIDYGLLVIGGETYKLHRKSINPIFHPTQLKSFTPIIKRKMDDFLLRFDSRIETSEQIEMSHFASDFTLDTILATMFSNNDITENERMRFIVSSEKYLLISCAKIFKWWLLIKPLFRLSKIYWPYMNSKDEINRFAEALMINFEKKYQQKLKAVDHKPQLFLDNFYNVRNTMTYKETRESVLTFLVAGFDTTGKTIPGVLLLLAMHQEIQENVLRELRKMKDEDMTEKTLNTLTYLDMVIKESLRLFPVGLLVARTVKEDIELKNFIVPSGTFIGCLVRDLHTDKKYWGDDAEIFNPERFSEENIKNINPNAYIPFSKGLRMCPGYRYAWITMRIFLSQFLMKYKVTTDLKLDELEYQFLVTLKIKQGYMLRVEKRQK